MMYDERFRWFNKVRSVKWNKIRNWNVDKGFGWVKKRK